MKRVVILLLILLIPLVSSAEPDYEFIFERNVSGQNLSITCKDTIMDTLCSDDFLCNVSVNYPDGTDLFNNSATSNIGRGRYIITLGNLTTNGFYSYYSECTNGSDSGVSDDLFFRVTESGQVYSEAQGLGGIGIIFSVMATAFFFMILGFKFSKNQKTLPLTLLFVVISIFLIFYSFVLGLNYSDNILEDEGLADLQSSIFIGTLWLVSGIGIISFILMTFAFVREFGKGRMMKNFGEGFDPITQTYQ